MNLGSAPTVTRARDAPSVIVVCMTERRAGRLEWNFGGWYGGQLGGTAWMLVAAILTAVRDPVIGLVALLLAAVPNVVGVVLWRRRERLSCYRSLQWLLVLIGVSGCAVVYLLDRSGWLEPIQVGGTVSAAGAYAAVVGTVAFLLLLFRIRFGSAEASD